MIWNDGGGFVGKHARRIRILFVKTAVMGKKRKLEEAESADVSVADNEVAYSEKLKYVNKIAKPMAGKKLTKKLLKLAKKGERIAPRVTCHCLNLFMFLHFSVKRQEN